MGGLIRRRVVRMLGAGATAGIKRESAVGDAESREEIDRDEFARAMHVLKLDLTKMELSRLFKRFDETGSGSIY